jgi:peroxiredoxin
MPLRYAFVAACFVLIVSACRRDEQAEIPPARQPPTAEAPDTEAVPARPAAPDFTLAGPDGEFRLDQHRGKVVLLTFWASWSEPSLAALDTAAVLATELAGDDFVAVGVSQDERGIDALREWAADSVSGNRVALTLLSDSAHVVARQYGNVEMLPTTVIVDREGRLHSRHVGMLSTEALLELVAPALIESGDGRPREVVSGAEVRALEVGQVQDLVAAGAALLDVRAGAERVTGGALAHAQRRPLSALERDDLPANLAGPIVFLGATLAEAQEAADRAARWGYRLVFTVVVEGEGRVIG